MPDTKSILAAIGQASYVWDIESGQITWSDNFSDLAGFKPGKDIASAREFESLLSVDSPKTRFAAVHDETPPEDNKKGASYQCTYAIRSDAVRSGQPVWIEDIGRWYANKDGRPQRAEGVVRIVNERRKREEKLRRKSEIDELTGLANRRMLQETIARTISHNFMHDKSAALLLVALGDFERINHTYGFNAGDEVLRQVSDLLCQQLRGDDFATRFSGAKFGLIIKQCKEDQLKAAARRLLAAINGRVLHTSCGPVSLKLSIGACLLPQHARNDIDAIAAATSALDRARSNFGNKVALFSPDPQAVSKRDRKARLLNRFVNAIENDSIHLAFQPIVDAGSGRTEFHEALLRLDGMVDEEINNAEFIHLAEDLGLMRVLDAKALKLGLDTLEAHRDAVISLNVTHDSLEAGSWLSSLCGRLDSNPELAHRLIVELTESHLPGDMEGTAEAIQRLKRLGCRVAIDDFGAGYTSFSHLRDLGVDIVKIDGSYARSLAADPANGIFLKSVRDMTKSFGMKTVVEWIEDIETALELKQCGHDYFQGSLYGMPLAVAPWEKIPAEPVDLKTGKTQKS